MKFGSIRIKAGLSLFLILFISLSLSWISSSFRSIDSFMPFLGVSVLGAALLIGGWGLLRGENIPAWVGCLMVGTMILRLGIGASWTIVLPQWGYETEGEVAGYVMSDAYRRDTTAWDLAQSNKSLLSAFKDYRVADQYGGLLFLSAFIYRFLGGNTHQPLMMVVLTSSFSALSILFVWVFAKRLWGKEAARSASWIVFAYPEGCLLGSSQMREAFMMSLAGMALYGLLLYWQERKWQGVVLVVLVLSVSLPLSYLFTITLLGVIFLVLLILDQGKVLRNWKLWLVLGVLLVVGISGIWVFSDRIFHQGATNLWELISQWLVSSAKWEQRLIEISSGWFAKILEGSPEWMHFFLFLGYGVVQPFLPAAVIASGNWTWRILAIIRALGWTSLLILLIYSPLRALKKVRKEHAAVGVALLVWVLILLAAYRGGGDQWDNPRYRVTFVVLQASLAGWVWVKQRNDPDPWLRRILVGMGLVFAWFVPWYLRRYSLTFTWNVIDLFKTIGLGVVSAVLYWLWDWVRSQSTSENDISGE